MYLMSCDYIPVFPSLTRVENKLLLYSCDKCYFTSVKSGMIAKLIHSILIKLSFYFSGDSMGCEVSRCLGK